MGFDFGALPLEVNSERMYSGPGRPRPLLRPRSRPWCLRRSSPPIALS